MPRRPVTVNPRPRKPDIRTAKAHQGDPSAHPRPVVSKAPRGTRRPISTIRIDW